VRALAAADEPPLSGCVAGAAGRAAAVLAAGGWRCLLCASANGAAAPRCVACGTDACGRLHDSTMADTLLRAPGVADKLAAAVREEFDQARFPWIVLPPTTPPPPPALAPPQRPLGARGVAEAMQRVSLDGAPGSVDAFGVPMDGFGDQPPAPPQVPGVQLRHPPAAPSLRASPLLVAPSGTLTGNAGAPAASSAPTPATFGGASIDGHLRAGSAPSANAEARPLREAAPPRVLTPPTPGPPPSPDPSATMHAHREPRLDGFGVAPTPGAAEGCVADATDVPRGVADGKPCASSVQMPVPGGPDESPPAESQSSSGVNGQSSLHALAAASDAANGGVGSATLESLATVTAMMSEGGSRNGRAASVVADGHYAMF
jgi:hypothetical protein